MQIIQTFSDGSALTFDEGVFDGWCVYLKRPREPEYAPTDLQCFEELEQLSKKHGCVKIYDDFITFYSATTGSIDQQVLHLIRQVSATYHKDALSIEILFATMYAGMIAEENKRFTKLKKRIKRLGVHQILVEKFSPDMAANFSRGKKWQDLDQICRQYGF